MVDLIETALSALPLLVPRREVGYKRGGETVTINATIARSAYFWVDNNDVRHYGEGRDYLIKPADLVIGGSIVEPVEGDQIVDEGNLYTVMAEGGGEVWRYESRYHKLLRVHTKESDDE